MIYKHHGGTIFIYHHHHNHNHHGICFIMLYNITSTHMIFFFFLYFLLQVSLIGIALYVIRYCSNYYSEYAEPIELCDWCQSEGKTTRSHGSSSKRSAGAASDSVSNRSEYSGDKIKQYDREDSGEKVKNPSGAPSPRPTTRRYKLLKDVMC